MNNEVFVKIVSSLFLLLFSMILNAYSVEFPEPSLKRSLFYMEDKFVLHMQDYRQVGDVRVYGPPDITFYSDKSLKNVVAALDIEGLKVGASQKCSYDYPISTDKPLEKQDIKYYITQMDNVKSLARQIRLACSSGGSRRCDPIDSNKPVADALIFGNFPIPDLYDESSLAICYFLQAKILEDPSYGFGPLNYGVSNIIIDDIKDGVGYLKHQILGDVYFKIPNVKSLEIAPPLKKLVEDDPTFKDFYKRYNDFKKNIPFKDHKLLQSFTSAKILDNYLEGKYKASELKIINLKSSLLVEKTKDKLCFWSLESPDNSEGFWCYVKDGTFFVTSNPKAFYPSPISHGDW